MFGIIETIAIVAAVKAVRKGYKAFRNDMDAMTEGTKASNPTRHNTGAERKIYEIRD